MNAAHFHLLVNHLPILFPIAGILVLLTGLISKSEAVKRTAYLIFIVGSLSTIFAMNSGEGAEEIVEHIGGISHDSIEEHEESAERFALFSYILGALSVIGLWASMKQKKFSKIIVLICLVFSCVVVFMGSKAGTSGGEIRHPEIRSDFTPSVMEHEHE